MKNDFLNKREETQKKANFFIKQIRNNSEVVDYFKNNYLEKERNLKFSDLGEIVNLKENKEI